MTPCAGAKLACNDAAAAQTQNCRQKRHPGPKEEEMDAAASEVLLTDSTKVEMQDDMPVGDPADKQYCVEAPAATAAGKSQSCCTTAVL